MRSLSPQNLEFNYLTLLFCRERLRNVLKCKTHVQKALLVSLIKLVVLCRYVLATVIIVVAKAS